MAFETVPANAPPNNIVFAHPGMTLDIDTVVLPEPTRAKLIELRQQIDDASVLTRAATDAAEEARNARMSHAARVKQLMAPRDYGGHNLPADAPLVVAELAKQDRAAAEYTRASELSDIRHARRSTLQRLLSRAESWIVSGRPAGTAIELHLDIEIALKKGESITDAIDNRRRRLRELAADVHRINSAPYPSSFAKQRMRAQIETLAQQGAPSVDGLLEHGSGEISFATTYLSLDVHGMKEAAFAAGSPVDAVALLCWLHRDALIAKLNSEIESEADDAVALTHEAREIARAQIADDRLAVEREEVALIELATSQGLNIDYREDTDPRALLGVRLVTAAAPAAAPATLGQWVVERIGA